MPGGIKDEFLFTGAGGGNTIQKRYCGCDQQLCETAEKGSNYVGVCPFHNDHSPSMSVNQPRQMYRCFSCGAGGDVFKFVMDYENLTFPEALKVLADRGRN